MALVSKLQIKTLILQMFFGRFIFICLSPRKLIIDPSCFDALKSAKLGVLESRQRSRTIWREILDLYKDHESEDSTLNFLDFSKYLL